MGPARLVLTFPGARPASKARNCAPKGRLLLVKIGETICHLGIQEKLNPSETVIQAKHPFY